MIALDINNREEVFSFLSGISLFSCFSSEALMNVFHGQPEIRHYDKGSIIYSRDSFIRAVGVIYSGSASVKKDSLSLSILKSGSLFGAVTLFSDHKKFAAEITALESCLVLFIDKEQISGLMTYSTAFSSNYISYLSDRIYFLNERIDALTGGTAEARLLTYLHYNAVLNDGDKSLLVKSYGNLASGLDIGRASLYRAMDSLEKKGIIRRENKTIFLLEDDIK